MENHMQKKIRNIIIFLIILICITLTAVIILLNQNKEEYNEEGIIKETKAYMKKVPSANEYYTVKSSIDKFYSNIATLNSEYKNKNITQEEYEKIIAKIIYNRFNKKYIEDKNITVESILLTYKGYEYSDFIIEDMYVTEQDNGISLYLVFGKQINKDENTNSEYGFLVALDWRNLIYSIAPYEFMEENDLTNVNKIIDNNIEIELDEIKENDDNTFSMIITDEKDLVRNIFSEYKLNIKYNIENAYNLLDEDYSKKRFKSKDIGEKYLKETYANVVGDSLSKMAVNDENNEYTQYVCKDNKENYFIINMKSESFSYTIQLDTYTIDIKQFLDKYNSASEENKVTLNLDKFRQMLNLKDYESAYNVLDETFRNTKFGTIDNFEQYVKDNWFDNNKFEYEEVNKNGNVYTLSTNIINNNADDNSYKQNINKVFIIKLKEGTDFAMSFNVDNKT